MTRLWLGEWLKIGCLDRMLPEPATRTARALYSPSHELRDRSVKMHGFNIEDDYLIAQCLRDMLEQWNLRRSALLTRKKLRFKVV